MPADIAQQFDGGKVRRPIEVIHHHRRLGRTSPAEIEEWRDLRLDLLDPIRNGLGVIELALGVLLRIPDQPSGPADERKRTVPGVLKSPQHEDLDEVSEVQARGRRIEAAVKRDRPIVERSTKCAEVRAHGNQTAPGEVIEEMGVWVTPESLRIGGVSARTAWLDGVSRRVRDRATRSARRPTKSATASAHPRT